MEICLYILKFSRRQNSVKSSCADRRVKCFKQPKLRETDSTFFVDSESPCWWRRNGWTKHLTQLSAQNILLWYSSAPPPSPFLKFLWWFSHNFVSVEFREDRLANLILVQEGFGGLVVSILATGTRVRGFKPGRSRWIFWASGKSSVCLTSERK